MGLTDPGISKSEFCTFSHHRVIQILKVSTTSTPLLEQDAFYYLQLAVMSVQLLHHLLGLAHTPAQLGRVLRRGQLAVVRLQNRSHPITLLSGRTETTFREKAPDLSPRRQFPEQYSTFLPIVLLHNKETLMDIRS